MQIIYNLEDFYINIIIELHYSIFIILRFRSLNKMNTYVENYSYKVEIFLSEHLKGILTYLYFNRLNSIKSCHPFLIL